MLSVEWLQFKKPAKLPTYGEDMLVLDRRSEVWRNSSMESFTSTPVYKDGRVYTTIKRGELVCLDADTGEEHWVLKLSPDQVHASPTWADGKLFVPMFDGKVFIVVDEGDSGKVISEIDLGSACLAAPSVAHGRVFIQTKKNCIVLVQQNLLRPSWSSHQKFQRDQIQLFHYRWCLLSLL